MSKRDTRFKHLKFDLNETNPNTVWSADGINGNVYYIVKIDDAYLALGLQDRHKCEQYYYRSDAAAVCQLDHEARIKEWLN